MNVQFQRRVDRIIGKTLCRFFSLLPRAGQKNRVSRKPQKILVILLSEMGSLALASPMFNYLRKKYSDASLYALLFERNKEFLDILNIIPKGNIITVRGEKPLDLMIDSIRSLRKLRRMGVDTVIDCELFSRVSSLYSLLSGARIRVGFHPYTQEGLYRGDFINRPVLYNPYHHISQQFLTLAKAIESTQTPKVKEKLNQEVFQLPTISITREERDLLIRKLMKDYPQIQRNKIVFIYPSGGLLPIRAWPIRNFLSVTKEMIKNGYLVGIIGMMNDKSLAKQILEHCADNNCMDLTGYTSSIRELLILLSLGSLLITNDGGPGHFASLSGIASIILFGPETPRLYRPLDPKSIALHIPLTCSPCLTAYNHRNSPCNGDNLCLKLIRPSDVLEKAISILSDQRGIEKDILFQGESI